MNMKKYLQIGAMVLITAGSASANVTYLSGATSFEAITDAALTNFVAANNGARVAWDNATLGKETNEIFTWGSSSPTNLILVHWTGSENVIQALAAPLASPVTLNYLATNATGLSTNTTNLKSPQVALYDNYQSTSIFNGTGAGDSKNYSTILNDTVVAAEGYVIIANTNWPIARATNITSAQVRELYAAGAVPLVYITGNQADTNSSVFAVGRNIDGGTRTVLLNESGIGVKSKIVQYQFTATNSITPYPIETIDGISSGRLGNSGYSTDGALRGIFTNVLAGGAGIDQSGNWAGYAGGSNYLVGYTSIHNATGSPGIVQLNYNGVAPTTANIQNGTYSLWAFAHVGVSPNFADATATNIGTSLANIILGFSSSALGAGNSALSDLQVTRDTDGGNIYWNQ